MGRQNQVRYTCDVADCAASEIISDPGGDPGGWGLIIVSRIRGHTDVPLWLCPEHFEVIDIWRYGE